MRDRIQALTLRAARAAVASYTGMPREEKAEVLVRSAIGRMPASGKLGTPQKLIIVALTHLLSEVPSTVRDYAQMVDAVRSLHKRAVG
jgi:hypothetical protein